MVGQDTRLSAAVFMNNQTAEATWRYFVSKWVSIYIVYPLNNNSDQGPQFD